MPILTLFNSKRKTLNMHEIKVSCFIFYRFSAKLIKMATIHNHLSWYVHKITGKEIWADH